MKDLLLSQFIKKLALDVGFDLVGITSSDPHAHRDFFNQWIDKKYHASMEWLERGKEKRNNPQLILSGAQSIICCGLIYRTEKATSLESEREGKGWISNYAWGDDYHEVFLDKLKMLENLILEKIPNARLKSYVDTGAILERSYAESAGLGWIGKNTCLINTKIGSFFFIGEILTDLELVPDQADNDHCGHCTRCIDACPTQALTPYELNSNKCISYLTIEHKSDIDPAIQEKMGHHIVGCDICQDVCPWNQRDPVVNINSGSQENFFQPREGNFHPSLLELSQMTKEEFSIRFKKSPIKRIKWENFQRNVQIVLNNNGNST